MCICPLKIVTASWQPYVKNYAPNLGADFGSRVSRGVVGSVGAAWARGEALGARELRLMEA